MHNSVGNHIIVALWCIVNQMCSRSKLINEINASVILGTVTQKNVLYITCIPACTHLGVCCA